MNTVVIKHVALSELPAAWRTRLPATPNARVTVRIEEEEEAEQPVLADNPLLGMRQYREPETKQVGGFRPFPARGAAATNDQVNNLRDREGV